MTYLYIDTILKKYDGLKGAEWYAAVSKYTKQMYEHPYVDMMLYSFKDVADAGDYRSCISLDEAEYNFLQINPAGLPLNARLGIWFPKEWTQSEMSAAGHVISSFISKVTSNQKNINTDFVQPKPWFAAQR
jgi:hypothetical protein